MKSLHDQLQVEMATDREIAMSSYEQTNVSSSELVKEVVQLNEGLRSLSFDTKTRLEKLETIISQITTSSSQ